MMRIGHGYDVHRLVRGRRLILGGVDIPHETGLLGHSDADVLTHAVMDALLGAAANGGVRGFSAEELARIEKRAYALGVKSYVALDVTQYYYQHAIKYKLFGNVLKNSTYPISVSSERISQATAIARYAREIGADYLCHGSTGAGNDQVRFDMIFNIVAPIGNRITCLSRCPKRFFFTHGVMFNYSASSRKNIFSGAVVLLQSYNFRCRKDFFKIQNIVNICTAEPVNRLVIVTNHAKVLVAGCQQT